MAKFFLKQKSFYYAFLVIIFFNSLAFGIAANISPVQAATLQASEKSYGVSTSGGEFGTQKIPGVLNNDYVYPSDIASDRYFAGKGLTLLRVPFLWERVQGQEFGSLTNADITQLESVLTTAQTAGEKVILDMHNYGRYNGVPLTKADAAAFADAWAKLASAFKGYPSLYGYELMNEPHDLPEGSDGWAYLAQAATTAIRTVDANSWILVPGYNWQSAKNWASSNPNLSITDPSGKLLYAAHQYFDSDGSGTYAKTYAADGSQPTTGTQDLQPFIDWLHQHNSLGIITEYGTPTDSQWLTADDNFLNKIETEPSLVGAIYWSSGPWWGSYQLSVQPTNNQDRPQMAIIQKYTSHIVGQSAPLIATPVQTAAPPPPVLPNPTPTQTTGSLSGYTFCANENQSCSFTGSRTVAYGANGHLVYLSLSNGTGCNNSVFGDPVVGTVKSCYIGNIIPTPTPQPTPTPSITPTPTIGTGLTGNYFSHKDLTGLQFSRIDSTVNFDWGLTSPDSRIPQDNFSVRWTGQVQAQYTEAYTFYTQSDDGVRLWINNVEIINNWTDHPRTENSGTINLVAGKNYNVVMEFYDHAWAAVAKLLWSSQSQPKQAIAQNYLYPTTGAVLGAETSIAYPAVQASQQLYTIKSGDTLWKLAMKFYGNGRLWTKIVKANHLSSPSILHKGSVIIIPQ